MKAIKISTERGATMVEYALMLAVLVMGCMVAVTSLVGPTVQPYDDASAAMNP